MLPRQQSAYTTAEARKTPMNLIVAPDHNGDSVGSLYLDGKFCPVVDVYDLRITRTIPPYDISSRHRMSY